MDKKEEMKTWLKHHDACADGYRWAIENCNSMDDVWRDAKPEWVIWVATRPKVLTDRELHEFVLWCAEQVRCLMTDKRSTNALDAKRKWLDGQITDQELDAAGDAAWAAWAAGAAAGVAGDAAWAAGVAGDAAWAAGVAAWAAGVAWAAGAAGDAQKKYITGNTNPQWNLS